MTKDTTTFTVILTVPESHLGKVLRTNIDYDPVSKLNLDVPYNRNTPRAGVKPIKPEKKTGKHRGKLTNAFLEMLENSPGNKVKVRDARDRMTELGFSGDGIYSLKTRLVSQKRIKQDGDTLILVKA